MSNTNQIQDDPFATSGDEHFEPQEVKMGMSMSLSTDKIMPIDSLVLISAMQDTGVRLLGRLFESLEGLSDQRVLDAYRATIAVDRASWLIRTKIASEALSRIRRKVTEGFRMGDLKKVDGQVGKEIKSLCSSLNVSYSQFMYDCRMFERLFDPANDALEDIPATEMIEATEVITSRSHFAEASDCRQPRAVIREVIRLSLGGTPVSAAAVREIKKTLNAQSDGKVYDPEAEPDIQPKPEPLVKAIYEGDYEPAILDLLVGIINAAEMIKSGESKSMYLRVVDGAVRSTQSLPGVSRARSINVLLILEKEKVSMNLSTLAGNSVMSLDQEEVALILKGRKKAEDG